MVGALSCSPANDGYRDNSTDSMTKIYVGFNLVLFFAVMSFLGAGNR